MVAPQPALSFAQSLQALLWATSRSTYRCAGLSSFPRLVRRGTRARNSVGDGEDCQSCGTQIPIFRCASTSVVVAMWVLLSEGGPVRWGSRQETGAYLLVVSSVCQMRAWWPRGFDLLCVQAIPPPTETHSCGGTYCAVLQFARHLHT